MEFWLGKIAWAIFAPSHFLIILLMLFLCLPMHRALRGFLCTGIAFFMLCAMALPLGDWALVPLEQCESKTQIPMKVDGVIVLGGAVDNESTIAAGGAEFNSAADRFIGMLKLMKTYPEAKIIYSGGPGSPKYPDFKEADYIKHAVADIGLDAARVVVENQARNTAENVAYTKSVFSNPPGQSWLIVTSAYHLPRALSLFREAGAASQTHFYPYATDFITGQRVHFQFTFDLPGNLGKLDTAVKEYAALGMNKLLGRSNRFLPCGEAEKEKLL
jgi:uncharacterized SAM-binding protein YcdF (DUF218 family)